MNYKIPISDYLSQQEVKKLFEDVCPNYDMSPTEANEHVNHIARGYVERTPNYNKLPEKERFRLFAHAYRFFLGIACPENPGCEFRPDAYSESEIYNAIESNALWLKGVPGHKQAYFSHACFIDFDFSGLQMNAVEFEMVQLYGANFNDADLTNSIISNCPASGAYFKNTNLTQVHACHCDFSGADLRGAHELDEHGNKIPITPDCDFSRSNNIEGAKFGPTAPIEGAKFGPRETVGA